MFVNDIQKISRMTKNQKVNLETEHIINKTICNILSVCWNIKNVHRTYDNYT